jgi:cell division protein FtsX
MSFSVVLIISLAAGVVLVVGGGLMMYMANLVKNAYELKVQISADVDERFTKLAEELDKKSRWIKRDLLEEIEKIKLAMQSDNARKFAEMTDPLSKRFDEMGELLRKERAEWVKAVESDRQNISALDQKLRALRRDAKKPDDGAAAPGGADAALEQAAQVLAAKAAAAEVAASAPAAKPAPPLLPDLASGA